MIGVRVGRSLPAVVLGSVVGSMLLFSPCARAQTPGAAAAFTIGTDVTPTIMSPEYNEFGKGLGGSLEFAGNSFTLTVRNSGSVATDGTPITIADILPAGMQVKDIRAEEFEANEKEGGLPCDAATVSCVYGAPLLPGDTLRMRVRVAIAPGVRSTVVNTATVSGGGAPSVSTVQSTRVGSSAESEAEGGGFEYLSAQVTGPEGSTDGQAGDHPYETNVSFFVNTVFSREGVIVPAGGLVGADGRPRADGGAIKDVITDLPPGFVGNPQVVAKCPEYLAAGRPEGKGGVGHGEGLFCPRDTQIGVITVYFDPRALTSGKLGAAEGNVTAVTTPIYNIVPADGYPAEFAFQVSGKVVALYVSVDPETNYGVRVVSSGISTFIKFVGASVTFFGTPATDPNLDDLDFGSGQPTAFLDDPVGCSEGPRFARVSADTWEHPGVWTANGAPDLSDPNWFTTSSTMFPSLTGCEALSFDPSIEVSPDTTRADEPSGLSVDLRVPQAVQQSPLMVTPELKDATVTLPQGLSVSPSAADGLQGCSDEQIALLSSSFGACPQASELGTVQIVTPLLAEPLQGAVFLGSPRCDPCSEADAVDGNMLRIFLEVHGAGVVVKKEGTVYANASTGQLTATFTDNPQLPFSELRLHFKGGLRAALATPQSCGTFDSTADLVPWSTPVTPDSVSVSPFNVDWDGDGGACPAVLPFAPSFNAGTSSANAGQFSPLTVTFDRQDREQDIAGIQVTMPPGLLGSLSGIPLCGEPQADLGTCSEASRIGGMTVAAGPGGHPFYTKGTLYLTGPYKGAPFGLSIVVPTVAGPFNLGNVVVRARVNVDPSTAALTVTTDALPQIIDGVPLRLRTANVTVDRPDFIFNPTNCALQHIQATVTGAQGAVDHTSVPFAVSGCKGLSFGPKFNVYTQGHTSRADGASLDVRLVYPPGPQSNIAKVRVELPKHLPSRLTTLQKACPAQTFERDAAACPAASVVGIAKAVSPVLPVPLIGPAYFVSHGGEAFPNLIVVLQGYGVRVDLVGDTFISTAGITSSTFNNVPDVQVSTFELYLPEGPYSALAANGNLCKQKRMTLPTLFTAQDGAQLKQDTPVRVTGCPKASAARRARNARGSVGVSRAPGARNAGRGLGRSRG